MTKFNPENKEEITYGECLGPAMSITDQADADQYFAAYLEWQTRHMKEATGRHTPEEICKINLGYWAGYSGNEVRERVEKLFKCSHPVFVSLKENGSPTSKEAFECGKQNVTLDQLRVNS